MGGMNEFLSQAYGTAAEQQPSADVEKVAQAELFAKLAAENGIDLNTLDDASVTELWNATFAKTAGEDEKEHGEKEHKGEHKEHGEKKAEAEALSEWMQTKEAQAKFAEADFFGRQMAHAYVAELRKIAEEGGLEFTEKDAFSLTEAGMKGRAAAKSVGKSLKDAFTGSQFREGRDLAKKVRSSEGHTLAGRAAMGAPKGKRDEAQKALLAGGEAAAKHHMRAGAAKTLGAYGAAGAAAGGAAKGVHSAVSGKDKKKKASALDEFAAPEAVKMAAAAGFDLDEAADRVSALLTLGVNESTKIAAAEDFAGAVGIRALELLEGAGYPVEWNQG